MVTRHPARVAVGVIAAHRSGKGQLMRLPTGIQYVVTAVLTGRAAFYLMMQTVNGGPWSWWGPVILAASILLLVDGIYSLVPRLAVMWLVVIAASVPIAICAPFGTLPLRCWVFAAIMALVEWAFLKVGAAIKRKGIAAFLASVVLVVSWVATSVSLVNYYLHSNTLRMSASLIVMFLMSWALVIGVLVRSGFDLFHMRSGGRVSV
jgi:hypothetical protein